MNIYTRSLNDAFKGFRSIASSLATKPAPQPTINLDDLPSKPKRPAASWNRFVMEKKSQLQGATSQRAEVMKELSAKWKTMSKSERAPYEAAAKQELDLYRLKLKQYKDVMNQTVPMSEMVRMLNLATKKKKAHAPHGKSGWNLFMIDVMAKDRPLLSNGKPDLSTIAKRWNQLSDAQKQVYNDRAKHQA